MAKTSLSQIMAKTSLPNATKIAILGVFNALVDDVETLRANQRALATKLDADAGVTDTNYASLASTAAGGLSVIK